LPPDVDERADAYASLSGRSAERAVADYRRARGTLADMVEEAAVVDEDAAQAYLDTLDWLIEVAQREGRGLYARP
jgi:Asp-tRNA(Asn)/Glu-tRNA(Gln) amidotransferase B subunit